jgi:hypothetical protein
VHHVAVQTEKGKRDAFTDYELAATAHISYAIKDAKWFETVTRYHNLSDTVIFQATSASGVVLGSAMSPFDIVGGNTSGTVSARIGGLSEQEITRISKLVAKWEYGRR